MNLSDNGYTFISQMEGIKTEAYLDSVNIPTIGIGFTHVNGIPVKMGQTMTLDEIKQQFIKQISTYVGCVNNNVTTTITQNQFDALVSFTFNLGCGALKSSTLLKKVNVNPDDLTIAKEFTKWDMAGGKVIQGLLNRRIKESKLYFS